MKRTLLFALVSLLACSTSAMAGGFAIIEQSVSGLGSAFSGGSASAEDASSMYFNPATMTLLKGQQVVGGTHVIIPSAKVTITEAKTAVPSPPFNNNVTGDNGVNAGVTGIVPNLYYVNNLGNGLAFGLGINAPFGLATDYSKNWIGRYHAIESDVKTININPAVAYKVNDKLSVGAGLNIMYMDVTLSSMANGGAAVLLGGNLATPNSTANDVFIENKADSWGYGYNLGAFYQLTENTRFGIAYRSKVKQDLEGTTKTEVPATIASIPLPNFGLIPAGALFQNQNVNGSIDLPATASLSVNQKVNDKLTLMGDVLWTDWSSFEELTLNFEGTGIGGKTSTTTVENWEDTWRFSVGATYQLNDALKLRCGLAFDQTPIPDSAHRTPRIPGEDRTWVALGAGYQFTKNLVGDFGYVHLFVKDSTIDQSLSDNPSAGSLIGGSENKVDIVSAQLSLNF